MPQPAGKLIASRALMLLTITLLTAALAGICLAAETRVGPQGQVMVDGRPTIPLGVWQQPPNLFRYHASLGINTLVVPPADVGRRASAGMYLDRAKEAGLGVMLSVYDENIGNHPALWGWDVGLLSGREAQWVSANGRRVRQADPQRLRMANVAAMSMVRNKGNDDTLRAGLKDVDVVVSHVWPEMYPNQPRDLRLVGDFVERIRELSADREGPAVSIWPDINPHAWRGKERQEYPAPTPEELRFQVWLALIKGANGICFFTISFEPFVYAQIPARNEQEMVRISALVGRLTPVLTAGPSPLEITATAEQEGAIVDVTTRFHQGAHYVFLLNGQDSRQTVTLKLDGLGTRYRLLNALPPEPVEMELAIAGQLEESLPGLALRIWKIVPIQNPPANQPQEGRQ